MARYSSLLQPMISFISASERYSGRWTGSTCVRTVCLCVCVCTLCVHVHTHLLHADGVSMACRFSGEQKYACWVHLCAVCYGVVCHCVHTHLQCTHTSAVSCHCSVRHLVGVSSFFATLRGVTREKSQEKIIKKKYTWLSTSASRALSSA